MSGFADDLTRQQMSPIRLAETGNVLVFHRNLQLTAVAKRWQGMRYTPGWGLLVVRAHMEDPLRLPIQELTSAWEAAHRIRETETLDQLNAEWAAVLNHLEKLWVKTDIACTAEKPGFSNWNAPWVKLRKSDPLLRYLIQARHADNHSVQYLSSQVIGHLLVDPKGRMGLNMLDSPELAIDQVINRGIKYPTPDTHLGQPLKTRDPRVLSVHACNFYADYLRQVRRSFLGLAP